MLVSLTRVITFAAQNFWRNFWLSLVTISIIALSFLSINIFILANALVDNAIAAVEQKVNVTVNFKVSAQEKDMFSIRDRLTAMPEVSGVDYISKQAALERFRDKHTRENDTGITDSLNELETNPLNASLIVRTHSVDQYPAVLKFLDQGEFTSIIEKNSYDDRTNLIDKISKLKEKIKQGGIIINIFFALIALLIVYNTIKITIYTRKDEIRIMKLVGATNWFIRLPLILESVFYSVIAITISILVLFPMLGVIQPYADRLFDGQAFDVLGFFSQNFLTIFGYQLLASMALNILSSFIAMGRYLKV